MQNEPSQYESGKIAGQIEQRLKEHDRHLDAINGSIESMHKSLDGLKAGLDRIATKEEIGKAVKENVLSTVQRRLGYFGLTVLAVTSLYTAFLK